MDIENNSWISEDFTPHLVSVIIPTYNRARYLQEAIQSVICQTYRPIECIVVDDGSTDNTKEVVEKFIAENHKDFVVNYIFQENLGSQVARNTGTKASTGQFIQYLDSDDLLYPDKVKTQVQFLNDNKDCDGVWGGWAKGTVEKNELIESIAREDLLTQFLTEHCIHTLSFLMRRNLVDKIGPWDVAIKRNQEIDFQVRGLLSGANYKCQTQICGLWRIHNGARIGNTTGLKDFMNFYQKWERILTEKGLFNNQMKKNISTIYYWAALQSNNKFDATAAKILAEALRLNQDIPFANSRKMKLFRRFLPTGVSIRIWLFCSKRNISKKDIRNFPEQEMNRI